MSNVTVSITPTSSPTTSVGVGKALDTQSIVITQVQAGPAGVAGKDGAGGDLSYVHDQMAPSTIWVVVHNLNKYPSVSVLDSAGSLWEGHVNYDSPNQLTISFTAAFGGFAYLN